MKQQIGVKAIIEQDNNILLIKRSKIYDHLDNAWDIPGGRINFGEEPLDGLKREIQEETGLELKKIHKILDTSTVFKNNEKHIVRITYLCSVKQGTIQLSKEHTKLQWIPKNKLHKQEYKDKLLKKTINTFTQQLEQ